MPEKDRARNAAAVENSDWVELQAGEQQFVGYDYTEYECRILRYRKVTQKKNEFYELVLDNTPFYGEMGGQVGDQGVLVSENETIEIIDTKRENGQSVHIVKQLPKDTIVMKRRPVKPGKCSQPHRYPPARLCFEAGIGRPRGAERFIREPRHPAFRLLTLRESY